MPLFSPAAAAGQAAGLLTAGGEAAALIAGKLGAPGGTPVTDSSGQDVLGNAATRRMCAGAYLDRDFRGQVLRDIYNARDRRAAPSYGCDVVVVLHHAWRAWWLELAQRCALLAVLGTALARVPREAVIAVSVLSICYQLGLLPRWARSMSGLYLGRGSDPQIRGMRTRGRLLAAGLAASFLALLTAMIISYSTGSTPVRPGLAWLGRTGLAGGAVILAAWGVIITGVAALRMIWLRRLRDRDARRPRALGRRMRVIDEQQSHPLTVHSGPKPFIGSGLRVDGWSFAQRLIADKMLAAEPDQEYLVPPFAGRDLVSRLEAMISGLRSNNHAETKLPGLDVAHHVFVEGTHAGPFRGVLRSHPDSPDVQNVMIEAIALPGSIARHYLTCRVQSWGGEIVTSVFARVSLEGCTLYLEFATYALLPTRTAYHSIDEPRQTGTAALARSIAAGMTGLPGQFLDVRFLATAPLQLWAALRPWKDLTHRKPVGSRADIGAALSAREEAAEADETYFQSQDILHHSKVIERRLIATVGDYLKEKGVDTSEFWARAQAILNNGVINTGSGSVSAPGSVFGQQNTVTSGTAAASEAPGPGQGTETGT